MKLLFLLFAITFYFPAFAQIRFDYPIKDIDSVELIATYSMKYEQDSTKPDYLEEEEMTLFIGKHVSKFISTSYYIGDSIMRRVSSSEEFEKMVANRNNPFPIVRFHYQIFKNYPKGKLTYIDHILGSGTFYYKENLDLFHWKLTGDTATISGYKAQKATCNFGGRSWIAWFTPEIPYSDGPYKFNGLPGLIVKVRDTRNQYVFELESFVKPKYRTMIDFVEDDLIKTTKKEFFRAKDNMREDIISRAIDAGLRNNLQQMVARKMKQRNNPIELKRK